MKGQVRLKVAEPVVILLIIFYLGVASIAATLIVEAVNGMERRRENDTVPIHRSEKNNEDLMDFEEKAEQTAPVPDEPEEIVGKGDDAVGQGDLPAGQKQGGKLTALLEAPFGAVPALPDNLTESRGAVTVDSNKIELPLPPVTTREPASSEITNETVPAAFPAVTAATQTTKTPPEIMDTSSGKKELEMDIKPVNEPVKPNIEKTSAQSGVSVPAGNPGAPKNQAPQAPKKKTDDLSELFAKHAVEENESGKLAAEMGDVNAQDLLTNGRDLISKLKRPRR